MNRVRRARAAALMLARAEGRSVVDVAERLLAIQAQDLRHGKLAIRERSKGLTAVDVDRALNERAIVVTWLNRGTLHITPAGDHAWLLALTARRNFTASRRRLAQLGVPPASAERAIEAMLGALASNGPMSRQAIGEVIASRKVATSGGALTHVIFEAALHGHVVLGPMEGKRHLVALTHDWLGPRPRVDLDTALAELARRYLRSRGPASARDLAYWAGINVGDARRGLERIAAECVDAGDGLIDLAERSPVPRRIPPRMLAAWDDYLLSWKDRSFAVPPQHGERVIAGGIISPALTVDGVVVGSWRAPASGVQLDVLDGTDPALFLDEIADVERFEGRV